MQVLLNSLGEDFPDFPTFQQMLRVYERELELSKPIEAKPRSAIRRAPQAPQAMPQRTTPQRTTQVRGHFDERAAVEYHRTHCLMLTPEERVAWRVVTACGICRSEKAR